MSNNQTPTTTTDNIVATDEQTVRRLLSITEREPYPIPGLAHIALDSVKPELDAAIHHYQEFLIAREHNPHVSESKILWEQDKALRAVKRMDTWEEYQRFLRRYEDCDLTHIAKLVIGRRLVPRTKMDFYHALGLRDELIYLGIPAWMSIMDHEHEFIARGSEMRNRIVVALFRNLHNLLRCQE
jgi:hypothetical protein